MSEPASFVPGRTPVFTTLVVLLGFAAVAWLGARLYLPRRADLAPHPADFPADQRWRYSPEGRAQHLADLRAQAQAAATTYAVLDREKGVARLPVAEAIRLTAREYGAKP